MKAVQVIDGAENCSFSVYAMNDDDFATMFAGCDQDVEFVEDLVARIGRQRAGELVLRATSTRLAKRTLKGIHGTLFIGLPEKRKFYPNKREDDFDHPNLALLLRRARPAKRGTRRSPRSRAVRLRPAAP